MRISLLEGSALPLRGKSLTVRGKSPTCRKFKRSWTVYDRATPVGDLETLNWLFGKSEARRAPDGKAGSNQS